MKKPDREDMGRLWSGRLAASWQVCEHLSPNWTRLEDALGGVFPRVVPRRTVLPNGVSGWDGEDEQINLNVTLAVMTYMSALAFDDQPVLRWSRYPDEDASVVSESERLAMMLMDDAEATAESRRAMRYMMTRGPWILWLYVDRVNATYEEIKATAIPPEDLVVAARAGTLEEIPFGIDYFKVAEVARGLLNDPAKALGLMPDEKARIAALAETCEVEHAKQRAKPHAPRSLARIGVEATPYGTWCRIDPTVTDVRRARWAARKIVMTAEEFMADPAFTDEAKAAVEPIRLRTSTPEAEAVLHDAAPGKTLEENGRVAFWEVHDRVHRTRHYVSDGKYPALMEKDDRHPFLDKEGDPIFPNFFPMVWRTPIQHNREKPEQALGIPYLAPGWPIQLEIIRTRSAYYNACKRSARVAVSNGKADDATLKQFEEAVDGTIVKPANQGYEPTRDGELLKPLDMGQAPIDYLQASMRLLADYANVSRVPLAALTGEPVADTLGQEEMAVKGSAVTQADVVRNLESGYAEAAKMAFALFVEYATPDEWVAYLGKSALKPVKDGRPMWQAVKEMGTDGRKLMARFASSIRAEDLARQKQRMDFFALSMGPLGRDSLGMPFFDAKSQLVNLAKEMEIEGLVPYEPSQAEILARVMASMQASMPQNNGESGDPTSRKAGGERGAPDVPGRQDRNESPPSTPQMQGAAMRPTNALA